MHVRRPAINRVLLVHPDTALRAMLTRAAERLQLEVIPAVDLDQALLCLETEGAFGLVMIGSRIGYSATRIPEPTGLPSVLGALAPRTGSAQLVVLVDESLSREVCAEALRCGASGFVDVSRGQLDEEGFARRLAQARQNYERSTDRATSSLSATAVQEESFVWRSPYMAELLSKAARASQVSDVPVLIQGESGTGKQLFAELIHRLDPKRLSKRFLSVNCAAISGTLAESALFGHVKGAFTGATESRKGHFRAADGGTILLDEVGEMDLALQPKLLRVLQEGVVMPLGSDDETPIDVRVIAATNRPLAVLVEQGKFRFDLFQRLNVIALEIPPLRERPEDIPALVRFFLRKYAAYYEKPIEAVDEEVQDFLTRCTLRGNVRELENAVRQILAFKSSGTRLRMEDVPPALLRNGGRDQRAPAGPALVLRDMADAACRLIERGDLTLPELVDACEKAVLTHTLQRANTTSARLARRLGLSRRTLYNKLRKHQLPAPGQVDSRDPGDPDTPGESA